MLASRMMTVRLSGSKSVQVSPSAILTTIPVSVTSGTGGAANAITEDRKHSNKRPMRKRTEVASVMISPFEPCAGAPDTYWYTVQLYGSDVFFPELKIGRGERPHVDGCPCAVSASGALYMCPK